MPIELTEPTQPTQRRLGRIYHPDPRDRAYTMTPRLLRAIAPAAKRRTRPWKIGPILDQGSTSQCTVYSFAQFLQSEPRWHALGWPAEHLRSIYDEAQAIDGIPGVHDGSTERAVLSVAQRTGLVAEYLWVADEDTAREYLATRGPLLFGSDWYDAMFDAGRHAYVDPGSSALAGGHETMLRWYYGPRHRCYPDSYEFVNSWGEGWGERGRFRMKAEVFRYLFLQSAGDLVSPIETAVVKPAKPTKSAKRARTAA